MITWWSVKAENLWFCSLVTENLVFWRETERAGDIRLCSIKETGRGKVKAAVITSQDRSKGKAIRRHGAQSIHYTKASDDISLCLALSLRVGCILATLCNLDSEDKTPFPSKKTYSLFCLPAGQSSYSSSLSTCYSRLIIIPWLRFYKSTSGDRKQTVVIDSCGTSRDAWLAPKQPHGKPVDGLISARTRVAPQHARIWISFLLLSGQFYRFSNTLKTQLRMNGY